MKALQEQGTGVLCFYWQDDRLGIMNNKKGMELLTQAGKIGFDVHRVLFNACEAKALTDAAKGAMGRVTRC